MKPIILVSVISITTALVLYTIAVWRNWRTKQLTTAQLVLLWLGLAADLLATRMMGLSIEGPIVWDFHTISGYTGLGLMALLAVLGSWARWRQHAGLLGSFHRIAIPVWLIWVASYVTGVIIGMQRV
ncbi:MAG: hypothetical protein D6727_12375 [Gammaproteobacteria bacterium]|nr:MAG: hypothetical protein D6727_12375 [Gammaproteobacteria bacterium]